MREEVRRRIRQTLQRFNKTNGELNMNLDNIKNPDCYFTDYDTVEKYNYYLINKYLEEIGAEDLLSIAYSLDISLNKLTYCSSVEKFLCMNFKYIGVISQETGGLYDHYTINCDVHTDNLKDGFKKMIARKINICNIHVNSIDSSKIVYLTPCPNTKRLNYKEYLYYNEKYVKTKPNFYSLLLTQLSKENQND